MQAGETELGRELQRRAAAGEDHLTRASQAA